MPAKFRPSSRSADPETDSMERKPVAKIAASTLNAKCEERQKENRWSRRELVHEKAPVAVAAEVPTKREEK